MGPRLAARLGREENGAFLEYMGDRVEEDLIWSPTTPAEVEELCRALEVGKGAGWEGVSPRVIRGVAQELSGSLSRLFNCCMRESHYPACFKVARVVPVFKGKGRIGQTMRVTALSRSSRCSLNSLRGCLGPGWLGFWTGTG